MWEYLQHGKKQHAQSKVKAKQRLERIIRLPPCPALSASWPGSAAMSACSRRV